LTNKGVADALIASLIRREGGFVDHAADRGGATKYGITIGTLRDWRRAPVSRDDVQNLTVEEATEIYRSRYFTASGFDQIEDPKLQELLFDFAVLSGVPRATQGLQEALGPAAGTADGVMGPKTMAALKNYQDDRRILFLRVKCERLEQFVRILSNPSQSVFAQGWANRLDEFKA
jgi:lysozyme family protein